MRVAGNKLIHLKNFFLTELAAETELSEIEAQFSITVEHYLGLSRSQQYLHLDDHVNQSDLLNIYNCAKAIKNNQPIQYILGKAHFYGLDFLVNSSVLIPRPETEELCDLILREKHKYQSALDIGTGSGCIPITLKKHLAHCKVHACDISNEAIITAQSNASLHEVEIHFFLCDILNQSPKDDNQLLKFDLIISNPPYILDSEKERMQAQVLNREPHLALFVNGEDAIIFYRKIIDLCGVQLNTEGHLFFELNPLSSADVLNYANKSQNFSSVEILKDMSGKDRFLKAIKR